MWDYVTAVRWAPGQDVQVETDGRPAMPVAPPPEFNGRPDRWNPELLLVSAVESCLLLTALSVAERQKLELLGYESKATGHLEKTPEGLRFTGIDVHVRVRSGDPERAKKIVQIAEKYCPVSNTVKCPVHVTVDSVA